MCGCQEGKKNKENKTKKADNQVFSVSPPLFHILSSEQHKQMSRGLFALLLT